MKIYSQDDITKKLKKKKNINKIIKIIFYPIIILVLVCNIIFMIQKIRNPEEFADIFGYKAFIIVSGSMEPNLKIGDVVIIKETKQEDIQKGDIITFKENSEAITHRVDEIINMDGQEYYRTKGDNNTSQDADLVEYKNIEGKFTFKIEGIGKIITNIQEPIIVIAIIIIMYVVYRIISKKTDRKEARHEKRKQMEKKEQIRKE